MGAKAEKTKNRQEKLAKVNSKIQVERRQQPKREAALTAAAVAAARSSEDEFSSDSEDLTSDSDCSVGSRASYDYEEDLQGFNYVTDSDFQDGLTGMDKQEFNAKHKKKKVFWINQGTQQFLYYKDVKQKINYHKNVKL